MLKNLPELELKLSLQAREDEFNRCRTIHGKVTKADLDSIDKENLKEITRSNTTTIKENIESLDTIVGSEDNTKATQTYTEKIKGGYFGKRRSRF